MAAICHTLCLAPIAIFDATDFEPAVMLALGVRAVVRRGVTLTSIADELTPTISRSCRSTSRKPG